MCVQLEARQLNHKEVVEEDRRRKLPANWESRQRRLEWEEADERARKVRKERESGCVCVLSDKSEIGTVDRIQH